MATASVATFFQDQAIKTARSAEVSVLADWDSGLNRGGSCAPGVGIGTGNGENKLDDWTLLDQTGAARNPQDSQHIGNGGVTGTPGPGTVPINVYDADATDYNDTVSLTNISTGWIRNAVP